MAKGGAVKLDGDSTANDLLFVQNYMGTLNVFEAYKKTFPNLESPSRVNAYNYAQRPGVKAILKKVLIDAQQEIGIVALRTVEELASIAFFDPIELIDPKTGKGLPLEKLPPAARHAVSDISIGPGGRVYYKLGAKLQALEKLSKIAQLIAPENLYVKVQHTDQPITPEEKAEKVKEFLSKVVKHHPANKNPEDD